MTRQDDLGQNTSRSTLVEEENKKTWKYFMEYLGTFYEGIKFACKTCYFQMGSCILIMARHVAYFIHGGAHELGNILLCQRSEFD